MSLFSEKVRPGMVFILLVKARFLFLRKINLEKKVPLAILEKGAYFGEQALLGHANKSRNASIEAIEETKLLRIKPRFINSLLNSESFKQNLFNIEKQQLIHKVARLSAFESIKSTLRKKQSLSITKMIKYFFRKATFLMPPILLCKGK